jgi:hypothetical protein
MDQLMYRPADAAPQISMTSRYTHVLPQVMTDAAARMGQALWGP